MKSKIVVGMGIFFVMAFGTFSAFHGAHSTPPKEKVIKEGASPSKVQS